NDAVAKLQEVRRHTNIPLVVRFGAAHDASAEQADAELEHLTPRLSAVADVLALEGVGRRPADRRRAMIRRVVQSAASRPVLLVVPADLQPEALAEQVALALEEGITGVLQEGSYEGEGGRVCGLPVLALALQQLRLLRSRWPELPLIGNGGVHEPA